MIQLARTCGLSQAVGGEQQGDYWYEPLSNASYWIHNTEAGVVSFLLDIKQSVLTI